MILQILPVTGPENPNVAKEFIVTIRGTAPEHEQLAQALLEGAKSPNGLAGTQITSDTGCPMRVIIDRKGPAIQGS